MSKDDLIKKWAPILDSMGVTASHWGNMAQLAENQSQQILEENTTSSETTTDEFSSILPIAMKVAAKTIGQDLIFASQEEINEVKNKVLTENRDGKIEAIVDGKEFIEKKLEEDPEYQKLMKKGVTPMSAPSGRLFYMDFKYGQQNEEKEDESPIKGRRGPRKGKN